MILKIYLSINNVHDHNLLESDIDCVQNWYVENDMILKVGKTTVTSLMHNAQNC
jgi:hypothetical protein